MDHLLSRSAERVDNTLLSAYFSYHIRAYPVIYNQTDCGACFLRVPQSQLLENVTKDSCHSLMRDLSFVITHLNRFMQVVLLHASSESKEEVRGISYFIEVDDTLKDILIVLSAEGGPSVILINPSGKMT